jgi:EmrB/QacA subfamily drug resistance transporter
MALAQRRATAAGGSIRLRSRSGVLTLALLAGVQFLDIVDASIVNVALPSIQRSLDFSQQNLQWVVSGYILTYGGFLLLGGRLADLLGRRRMLAVGVMLFAVSSLAGGLATGQGLLVGARVIQGGSAALMAPAALSALTTAFPEGRDRNAALGVWGAVSGMAAAAGVLFGGLLTDGPGWRWVLFVNPPLCVVVLAGALRLLPGDTTRERTSTFDTQGAVLVTGGMLLLVYGLVRAPVAGWATGETVLPLVGAGILLTAFAVNELGSPNPLVPFSILRVNGLVAANATQLIAFAGAFTMFFFTTLYMQEVLGYSPLKAGVAYLPITAGFAVSGGVASQLVTRVGTRPVVVAGALIGGAGIYSLSRLPLEGSYLADLLPGFVVMALGMGSVFVAVIAAASAGVPGDRAGLAAGLLNASQQVGSALGLAIISAIAISRTDELLAAHAVRVEALDAGYHRGLLIGSISMLGAAIIALRIGNTRTAGPLVLAPSEAPPGSLSSQ